MIDGSVSKTRGYCFQVCAVVETARKMAISQAAEPNSRGEPILGKLSRLTSLMTVWQARCKQNSSSSRVATPGLKNPSAMSLWYTYPFQTRTTRYLIKFQFLWRELQLESVYHEPRTFAFSRANVQ